VAEIEWERGIKGEGGREIRHLENC